METRELLLALLHADAESDVVSILKAAGYWDDDSVWRYYGDDEGNYRIGGNQAGRPEPALVEKIVNSIDAMLIRHCHERDIDPTGPAAPQSVRDAIATFYEGGRTGSYHGNIANWTEAELLSAARDISVSLTGETPGQATGLGFPSITIVDAGEGQAPEQLPNTILSLRKGLKSSIPFVQGKFNMGGTAALRFAGTQNLQLILSKRHPKLAKREHSSTSWGYTVVRLETPPGARMSTYRYLAPVPSDDGSTTGDVLRLNDLTLPLVPDGNQAYAKNAEWGTLVKLYEYRTRARTSFFQRGGLLNPLDVFLPRIPLPVRLHECRAFGGRRGSFETTLTGIEIRLNRSEHLELGPDAGIITIRGTSIPYRIYCTKNGAARKRYRGDDAVIFSVNGQTHATISERFFRRSRVAMGVLARDITVILDCSSLDVRSSEQLFLNSRDRLAESDLRRDIEEQLEIAIGDHHGLRELRQQRVREETERKLGNDAPLADAIRAILQRNPTLSRLFLTGERLPNPFDSRAESPNGGPFEGRRHPEVFKFRQITYGSELNRSAHMNTRFRIDFETDDVNEYFDRDSDPGELSLLATLSGEPCTIDNYTMNLFSGYAHLNCRLPAEAKVGDQMRLEVRVHDVGHAEPFTNVANLSVLDAAPKNPSKGRGGRRERKAAGGDESKPAGIALPDVILVSEDEWPARDMDKFSALRVERVEAVGDSGEPGQFRFYVNIDNIYLKTEQKSKPDAARLSRARFETGLTLLGLGIIREQVASPREAEPSPNDGDAQPTVEDIVARATDGIAPMLLPMIESLATLEPSAVDDGEDLTPDLDAPE